MYNVYIYIWSMFKGSFLTNQHFMTLAWRVTGKSSTSPHGPRDLLKTATDAVLSAQAERHGQSHCVRWCSTASKQQPRVSFKAKDYQTISNPTMTCEPLFCSGGATNFVYFHIFCLFGLLPTGWQTNSELLFAHGFQRANPWTRLQLSLIYQCRTCIMISTIRSDINPFR